jgi:hypothetical protein
MHSVSLLALRNRVRVTTDTENAQRPTDLQLNEMLNGSIRSLFAGLADGASSLLLSVNTATMTAGTTGITLSAAVWQLRSVTVILADGTRRDLDPFQTLERSDILNNDLPDGPWFYRLAGILGGAPQLEMLPSPSADATIEYYFIPTPTILSADGDLLYCLPGWDAWVVYDTAIQVLGAEETDVSVWMGMRDQVWQREIVPATKSRDSFKRKRVVRVRR